MARAFIKQNAFLKFVLTSSSLYLILYLIYQFVVKRHTYYDQKFIGTIIQGSDFFLRSIGYKTFTVLQDRDFQIVGIDGSNGVWVGSNCNAISLFTLFSVFILAYPGHQKSKIWFIPLGIIAIHVLNLIRVIALVLIANYYPMYLDFNHTYTFTFLVYSFIFFLWVICVNKFSTKSVAKKNEI